jgi:AcrR family transcriptional regulator
VVKARIDEIADEAWDLVEEAGAEGLTMRALASRLGVSAPSLYKHVADRHAIVALVQARALIAGADVMRRAIARHPESPNLPTALAYRRWALKHPHVYRLTNDQQLLRNLLPSGLEEACAAPIVTLAGGDQDRARVLWATAHGLISLELAGRFPPHANLDAAWRQAFENI